MLRRAMTLVALSLSIVALPFGSFLSAQTQPSPRDARSELVERLNRATGGKVRVAYREGNERARVIAAPPGSAFPVDGVQPGASREHVARAFLDEYGALFGVDDASAELRAMPIQPGSRAVHFEQVVDGVPVLGGELAVDTRADGAVVSANGETLPGAAPSTTPAVDARTASDAALAVTAKAHGVAANGLQASPPQLAIYDNRLLGAPGLDRALLVWRTDVRDVQRAIDELVLVDAQSGGIALNFDQLAEAKNRQVCDRQNIVGGAEACTSPFTRTEGQAVTGIPDVDLAYDYAGSTYDFYFAKFGRDSLNGAGFTLKSTVRYCPGVTACPYENAYWNGAQMVYGDGFAKADDVVGHELTHGVTEFESHLFYYYQAGALNESLSDVFGELIDLTNGLGNDSPAVRWDMGEDLPGGALRDMANPGAFGDPDRTGSANYFGGTTDNGGVHTNSGVNNKAAALLTDGGTFNGKTVTALGTDKVARIYYKMAVDLLTSASDYQDVSELLPQACAALVGTASITTTDCGQVTNTVRATEMHVPPANAAATEAPVCDPGNAPTNLFFDNLENTASGNWVTTPATGTNRWYYPQNPNPLFDLTYATSGTTNMFGIDAGVATDINIARTANTAIPGGTTTYLRFNHSYDLESGFDGGRLEYSTNDGGAWVDARSLFTHNGYSRNATAAGTSFSGQSRGYISSRVDLTSLAGQNVRFRFRIQTDGSVGRLGWFVDDIRVYRCDASAPPIANAGGDQQVNSGAAFTLDGSGSSSPTGLPLTYLWIQLSGTQAVIQNDRAAATVVNGVPGAATLTFQLTVKDSNGQTTTDTVVVNVKAPK